MVASRSCPEGDERETRSTLTWARVEGWRLIATFRMD